MKVLMINSVCGIKSTGRICTDLAEVLLENGHECRIAYGRELVPEKYKKISYRIGSTFEVYLHALISRVFDSAGFGSKYATKRLIKKIRDFAPDVIHLHNIHGYYINVEVLFDFLAKANIPVIWTLHDCWAFTGHCAYFSAVECEYWKIGCHHCPQKTSYPTSVFLDCSEKNWNKKRKLFTSVKNMTIITPSNWLANLSTKSFLESYEVKVIPNGIDLSAFKPTQSDFREKYGLLDKIIVLGVASFWSDRKGLDIFKQIADKLDERYQVIVVGLSEQQLNENLNNILGLPPTNSIEELAQIYTAADVFLNPSKEETMGLTTVEAMACGTPVVVSNLTAVPEVVTSFGGVVVEQLTTTEIISGIEEVLEKSLEPRKNAQQYEKEEQYLKYLELYQKIYGDFK